ncbi:carbamoyltransferase HypF [Plantactinospora sp. WMMB334]|uniref:carbamoyltransferase HypF n=1 Tax=Plantactinospora sp. WMMB334 TaxID=3404119 RepID=UPI003B945169
MTTASVWDHAETPSARVPGRAGTTASRAAGRGGGLRIEVHGVVQGVGFRPFVYRTAVACGLRGDVRNAGGHVTIQVFGPDGAVAAFLDRLVLDAPGQARIDRVETVPLDGRAPDTAFRVVASTGATGGDRDLPPDLDTCPACLRELFDPADRRHRYPFINCTDCGPRATIVTDLPYDRARTTMAGFPMCDDCAAEYHDPADRRFHAEPIACPACGPRLAWWTGAAGHGTGEAGHGTGEAALSAAIATIEGGGLVAVKGIGGYQLVCDATSAAAVARVRAAKHRPAKPLAVMVPDLAAAERLVRLDAAERALLYDVARPIVLARSRAGTVRATWRAPGTAPAASPAPGGGATAGRADGPALAAGVTGGLSEVGIFLPYSPLHHLLLAALARPLVVTSGNRAGEPIATEPATARRVLAPLVDGVLDHDRPIHSRYDDSVVRVVAGTRRVLRRARGYAPETLPLPVSAPEPVLAVGAQLKQTTTLAIGDRAVVGPHTGDLENAETLAAFEETVARLARLRAARPRVVAHDPHPGYLSTQYAVAHFPADRRVAVQHHHAHVAAVAAEHGLPEPFVGIAYDGLGLGADGTFWGGEVLLAGYTGYRRVGRFARAPMPGGAAAIRRPARMALGYLFGVEDLGAGRPDPALAAALLARLDGPEVAVLRRMVERRLNCPLASSAGRLFDAVASLLGVADDSGYEGEAAIRLEAAAEPYPEASPLRWRLVERDGLRVYDPAPTIADALERALGEPAGLVAARFHSTVVEVTVALAEAAAGAGRPNRTVCLGGGVFQNRRLAAATVAALDAAGFAAHLGGRIPVNDGGISYGQAVVAAARLGGR